MGQTALDIPKSGTLVVRIKMTVYGLWHLWLITGFGDAVFSVGSDRSLTFFAWVFGERNRSKEKHVFRMGLLPNRGCPHFSSCCLIDKYTYITYIIIYMHIIHYTSLTSKSVFRFHLPQSDPPSPPYCIVMNRGCAHRAERIRPHFVPIFYPRW